mmetsp:Transcript_105/g.342  ORF Transcript_105/g.342 Transcript_105/m.342 type:complete len:396 (+) Transcript_105:371-1558(+)
MAAASSSRPACTPRTAPASASVAPMDAARRSRSGATGRRPSPSNVAWMSDHTSPSRNATYDSTARSVALSSGPRYDRLAKPTMESTANTRPIVSRAATPSADASCAAAPAPLNPYVAPALGTFHSLASPLPARGLEALASVPSGPTTPSTCSRLRQKPRSSPAAVSPDDLPAAPDRQSWKNSWLLGFSSTSARQLSTTHRSGAPHASARSRSAATPPMATKRTRFLRCATTPLHRHPTTAAGKEEGAEGSAARSATSSLRSAVTPCSLRRALAFSSSPSHSAPSTAAASSLVRSPSFVSQKRSSARETPPAAPTSRLCPPPRAAASATPRAARISGSPTPLVMKRSTAPGPPPASNAEGRSGARERSAESAWARRSTPWDLVHLLCGPPPCSIST